MAKTQYLEYTVHLTDPDVVSRLNALYPDGVNRAPYTFGPPEGGMAVEAAIEAGIYPPAIPIVAADAPFTAPALTSPWFDATSSSSTFPRDVAVFTRSSGWWIFGSSTTFKWIAKFAYSPSADLGTGETPGPDTSTIPPTTPDVVVRAPMPARTHVDGLGELGGGGEGATSSSDNNKVPAGATLYEGTGFAFRQRGTTSEYHQYQYSTPARNKLWSRFYFRLRKLPTAAPVQLFRITNFSSSGSGLRVYITALGQYAFYAVPSSALGENLIGTAGVVPLNTRLRVDAFSYIGPDVTAAAGESLMYFCVNGELIGTLSVAHGGIVANVRFESIYLGHNYGTQTGAEIDFDDWRESDLPIDKDFKTPAYDNTVAYNAGDLVKWTDGMPTTAAEIAATGFSKPILGFEIFEKLDTGAAGAPPRAGSVMNTAHWRKLTDSADFALGTRIVVARPKSAAAIADWTPADSRAVGQPVTNLTNQGVTSIVSGADLQLVTDAVDRLAAIPGCVGWASITIGLRSLRGTNSGQLGYKIGTGAPVLTAITEAAALGWNTVLYAPTLTEPEAISALEVHYKKGADVVLARVVMLAAAVEVCGIFAREDRPKLWNPTTNLWEDSQADAPIEPSGLHAAPYPKTPWFRQSLPPLGPVMIVGGTYVGATNGLSLSFKVPPAFIWIRPTTTTTPGAKWFSAMAAIGAIRGLDRGLGYILIPRVYKDDAFVPASADADQQMSFAVDIGGADASINTNGVTYQYIAFCDPSARFCLTGAGRFSNDALPTVHVLERSAFLPEFGLFHRGLVGTNTTNELWAKGAGHAAAGASDISAVAEAANAITWAAGQLTLNSGFVNATVYDQVSYCLFRRQDGNADPNATSLMAIGTYVGDGAASRSIATGASSGKRPLFLIVCPHNAVAAHYRDPSHTGTTSQLITGASQATTGISAGSVDGFTVGSTLNANGVTYTYFMLLGSATAGNGGWSGNGEYSPVPSDSPVDPTYETPPTEPAPTPEPEPEPQPQEPDLAATCVAATQKVVNKSLHHIGVSKQIADLVGENSQEADTSRLHIKDDVDEVLRRFAWPFAKRYATLVLVSGTDTVPTNPDWQYAYRAPADMVEARRLTSRMGTQRRWDPNPPAFERGSDVGGDVIFTNEPTTTDAPLVLEYTARLSCPALSGDALFRAALEWKHAASLAPALSKDPNKGPYCEARFRDVLETAKVRWGNEQEPQRPDSGDPDWIRGR